MLAVILKSIGSIVISDEKFKPAANRGEVDRSKFAVVSQTTSNTNKADGMVLKVIRNITVILTPSLIPFNN